MWPFSKEAGGEDTVGEVVRPDSPPEYDLLVAQEFEQRGRPQEALAAYERALAKDPDSAYLERKLAQALVRQNQLSEGLKHAERAHSLDPDDTSTRLFLGQLYRLQRSPAAAARVLLDDAGEPLGESAAYLLYEIYMDANRGADALAVAQWVAERDPKSVRTRVALAAAYDVMGQHEDSERTLREAIDEDPRDMAIYVALARSRRERGDSEGEMDVYREILARDPGHHAALLSLSDAQLKAEDHEGAVKTLEEIERRYPEDLRSIVRLAFLYYEDRRYEEAAERFARVVAVTPEESELVFFLGVAQRKSGDSEQARLTFEQIPTQSENYSDARAQLAALYERQGDFANALVEIEKAHAVNPSRELMLYAATLRSKAGDFDGAVDRLNKMLDESPDDDELLYNLGVIYGEADRIDESIAYMQRAVEINPDNANALNYIGYTWAERGINLDEAESLIARALDLRPEDGYIADSLGWVYYMRAVPLVEEGQPVAAQEFIERALEQLERAADLTGGDPVVSEHIGDAYLLLDDKERALDRFEEALRLEPRFGEQPDLLRKLEDLRRELQ
jgi:tetratricopeptide (TPR) repeat protein